MRLGDLDALKEKLSGEDYQTYTHEYGYAIPTEWVMNAIDNAPTVSEITKEKLSIAYDQGYKDGRDNWLQEERPQQGEWKEWTDERWGGTTIYCPYCKEHALEKYIDGLHRQVKSNFCPNCGAKLKKGGTE